MTYNPEAVDYFTDPSVLRNPFPYFENLRKQGPVAWIKDRNIAAVVGYQECIDVLSNEKNFSPVVSSPSACLQPLPFEPQGDDISEQIEANRDKISHSFLMTALEGERHKANRSLITGLFVPSRLKANEEYMTGLARDMVGEAVGRGGCEVMKDVAVPFVTLVIADLLGVPREDRQTFREVQEQAPVTGSIDMKPKSGAQDPMQFMAGYFHRYIVDRRANPKDDILTDLATQKYPDGSTPEVMDIVTTAIFLFGAGGDTTNKLIGSAMRYLVEDPELQRHLREDRKLIPTFLEEILRLEGAVKVLFRLARKTTTVGGVTIPAGTKVVVCLAAANRDPVRWENPDDFNLERPRIMQHLAFSRASHTCIGNPLARTEGRVILEQFLGQTSNITLSEEHHGPLGNHQLDYEASFLLRGLERLHVKFEPA